jgi:1,4-alpha-glucan branching enzyme
MPDRYFSLVLHSHIPYVLAHGSWPHGMDWLHEAAAESYLPLLRVFERLADEGVPARANVSFTPVLMEQLGAAEFGPGFEAYLGMKIEAAASDGRHFRSTGSSGLEALANYWGEWYRGLLEDFRGRYRGGILAGFRSLQDRGAIEVLTSGATHAYFPLLARDESVRQQVRQGRHTYRLHFGREARAFWLPECGYRPGYAWQNPIDGGASYPRQGVDEILASEGLGCFFVDSAMIRGGQTKGVYIDRFPVLKRLWDNSRDAGAPAGDGANDPYAAYRAHPSGVAFFARDEVSGSQVWSRTLGYPGDGAYLEFHKKHFPGGLRYWRVTSDGADLGLKEPYDPAAAAERLEAHAAHFVAVLESELAGRAEGTITALYDTELFGHWWFEGPEWLYHVARRLAVASVEPMNVSEVLERTPPRAALSLPEGSWGQGGFHSIWLNDDTAWIWRKIYRIEEAAAGLPPDPSPLGRRLLRQFSREKLLLESSDWPFLVSTWSARDYAENRAAEHFERALTLAGWLEAGRPLEASEEALLGAFEAEDHLFEEVVSPDGTLI